MNSLTIYPSFSGLIREQERNNVAESVLNDSNTIFYFGCSRAGIEQTVSGFGMGNHNKAWEVLRPILEMAESQGRVLWATQDHLADFTWLADNISSRGGTWTWGKDDILEELHWRAHNIPTMRDLCHSVKNLKVYYQWK